MAVTKSWESKVLAAPEEVEKPRRRASSFHLIWLLGASLIVGSGLAAVYSAKTQNLPEVNRQLATGELLNLNAVKNTDQLLPFLIVFNEIAERQLVATKIIDYLHSHPPLPNVGALARLRVSQSEIENNPDWSALRSELRRRQAQPGKPHTGESRLGLL